MAEKKRYGVLEMEEEQQQRLEEMTMDLVQVGDSLDEREHAYKGKKTWTRAFRGRTRFHCEDRQALSIRSRQSIHRRHFFKCQV